MLQKVRFSRWFGQFTETFGLGRGAGIAAVAVIVVAVASAAFLALNSGPPKSLTITAGPEGSFFATNAWKYAQILARDHVRLKILYSKGSEENLQRLSATGSKVDVGFVQGGVTNLSGARPLLSLGSIAYEPLFVFHRTNLSPVLLSDFRGKRLSIGAPGSGSHSLAMTLLATNGIAPGGATALLEMDGEAGVVDMLAGKVDAVFVMTDSISSKTLRDLRSNPACKLFDFTQATAYVRRITYLNKLTIPEGSFDFGKNVPDHDVHLLGPTVELIVGADLHPVLSDLLLEAAKEVHGKPQLLQQRGEFPAPLEHDFPISPDAARYYKTGKSFLYKWLPFGLAGIVQKLVVAIVPMAIVLIPGLKLIPTIFRWRVKLMLFRWYRALQSVERGLYGPVPLEKRHELLHRLDHIESTVKDIKVPASFADQFYGLRGHIYFVRAKLNDLGPAAPVAAAKR